MAATSSKMKQIKNGVDTLGSKNERSNPFYVCMNSGIYQWTKEDCAEKGCGEIPLRKKEKQGWGTPAKSDNTWANSIYTGEAWHKLYNGVSAKASVGAATEWATTLLKKSKKGTWIKRKKHFPKEKTPSYLPFSGDAPRNRGRGPPSPPTGALWPNWSIGPSWRVETGPADRGKCHTDLRRSNRTTKGTASTTRFSNVLTMLIGLAEQWRVRKTRRRSGSYKLDPWWWLVERHYVDERIL